VQTARVYGMGNAKAARLAAAFEIARRLSREKQPISRGTFDTDLAGAGLVSSMAKQRQEFVKARVRQLGKRLADLSMVNMNNIPKDKVGLGSTVKVYDSTKNEEIEYNIVTSEESDVGSGKISTTSPIGRALLNKKVGDTATVVTPNGEREMEILSLTTIHDEAEV